MSNGTIFTQDTVNENAVITNVKVVTKELGLEAQAEVPVSLFSVFVHQNAVLEQPVQKHKYGMTCLFLWTAQQRGQSIKNLGFVDIVIDNLLLATVQAFVGDRIWRMALETQGDEHLTVWVLYQALQKSKKTGDCFVRLYSK